MKSEQPNLNGPIPQRRYNEDVNLSIVGFGGIVVMSQSQQAGNNEVARAVDRGINYFDVAPLYGDGEAEQKLGPALKPFRDRIFLACKTAERGAEAARNELETSLNRLQTDHFDLYQLHNMHQPEEIEQIFAPGGAMEVLVKAREEGKIRYLGFSTHNEDVAIELLDRFDWDSVLFPVNYVCFAHNSFGPRLMAKAKEKKVARLALKALAYTPWAAQQQKSPDAYPKCWYRPIDEIKQAQDAMRFTLSEDITSMIPPGAEQVYRMAEDFASSYTPLSPNERIELLAVAMETKPIFP